MADINDILKRAEGGGYRRVKTVDLFDGSLVDEHVQLEAELARAIEGDRQQTDISHVPTAPDVARRIADLESRIESSAIRFKFAALSFRAWNDLLAAHPPTKAQLKAAAEKSTSWRDRVTLDHNPDTFPAALVAACAVEPEMTVEQADQLADAFGPDQFEMLYRTALEVNHGGNDNPKSVAAGAILQTSSRFDDTPAPAAFAAPTS